MTGVCENLHDPAPCHVAGDVHHHGKTEIGDPAVPMEQLGDKIRGESHQRDRKDQAEDQKAVMTLGGTTDGEHIVQRHRHIRHDDQHESLAHGGGLLLRAAGHPGTGVVARISGHAATADFTPHAPANPEQEEAPGEQEADDAQKFDDNERETDAQDGCGNDPDDDGPSAKGRGQAGDGHSDDDGIVTGHDDVNEYDGEQGGELGKVRRIENFQHWPAPLLVPGCNMWQLERLAKGERAMDASADPITDVIGRTRSSVEVLGVPPARHLAATFDRDADGLEAGSALPPGWTLLYFLDAPPTSVVGRDGRTSPGEFIPDTGLPRRMWAGGSFTFSGDLILGRPATSTVTIRNVARKEGRSGVLCFVTTEHRIEQDGRDVVTEIRNLVFREAPKSSEPVRRVDPPGPATWRRSTVADPVLLFRFSALTFNAHRIHYDIEYCRNEEDYPNLVVHGPMQALLLLDLVERVFPGRRIRQFVYRGVAPVFAPESFSVCGAPDGDDRVRLWIEDSGGGLATTAELELA